MTSAAEKNIDRLIFVWLHRCFPAIRNAITVVKPETVIRWYRHGFRSYWRWKSRRCGGRPRVEREIRYLIRRMHKENPLWGAPRIHGELLIGSIRRKSLDHFIVFGEVHLRGVLKGLRFVLQ